MKIGLLPHTSYSIVLHQDLDTSMSYYDALDLVLHHKTSITYSASRQQFQEIDIFISSHHKHMEFFVRKRK